MAPLCRKVTGADIVPGFVNECQEMIDRKSIRNAAAVLLEKGKLPFADGEFDKVVMIDAIHHLEEHERTLAEVFRVLKPNGHFLIFEPNKLNPLLALLCVLDKNEHGLLRLGTFGAYRRLLGKNFQVEDEEYSGVLIGPESRAAVALADFVSNPKHAGFGWLSPKLFVAARKV
jgi:ubiquinone/menaquinone biosynthesis C-methylase UbiE